MFFALFVLLPLAAAQIMSWGDVNNFVLGPGVTMAFLFAVLIICAVILVICCLYLVVMYFMIKSFQSDKKSRKGDY